MKTKLNPLFNFCFHDFNKNNMKNSVAAVLLFLANPFTFNSYRKLSSFNTSYSRLGDLIESMVDFEGEIDSEDEEESGEQGSSSTARPSSPKDELKKLEEQKICKICRKENVEVLFLPCGHLVSCSQCSSTASQCPVCKMAVTDKIRIYAV